MYFLQLKLFIFIITRALIQHTNTILLRKGFYKLLNIMIFQIDILKRFGRLTQTFIDGYLLEYNGLCLFACLHHCKSIM